MYCKAELRQRIALMSSALVWQSLVQLRAANCFVESCGVFSSIGTVKLGLAQPWCCGVKYGNAVVR